MFVSAVFKVQWRGYIHDSVARDLVKQTRIILKMKPGKVPQYLNLHKENHHTIFSVVGLCLQRRGQTKKKISAAKVKDNG